MLDKNDPEFDDTEDNFLTQREVSIKHPHRCLGSNQDHRLHGHQFPGLLNEVSHCWLFHDLFENSYGLKQPSLTLQDCIRVGSIWVDVSVRHQATLDIKSGQWKQPQDSD